MTSHPTPQYRYQSNAKDLRLTTELYQWLLNGHLSRITLAHVLAASVKKVGIPAHSGCSRAAGTRWNAYFFYRCVSPAIRKELMERLWTHQVESASLETSSSGPTPSLSVLNRLIPRTAVYSLPLQEIDVLVNGAIPEAGVLDGGSQIIVIRLDLAQKVGADISPNLQLDMEGINTLSTTLGCAENLTMQVGNVVFKVHAHVVKCAPFRLLLGRPFLHLLLCLLEDYPDRSVGVTICDPANPSHPINIPSRAHTTQVGCIRAFSLVSSPSPPKLNGLWQHHNIVYSFLADSDDPPKRVLAYKKVAKKVQPVSTSLPEDYRIIRRIPKDPLLSLPALPTHPPDFTPGSRLTQERLNALDLNCYGFLLPNELKLLTHVLRINEHGLAWTEAEKGHFRDDYVSPVKIPVIEHMPWIQKNIPIPTSILKQVIQIFRDKFAAGVYEHSDASYQSRWFCVEKKNGSL